MISLFSTDLLFSRIFSFSIGFIDIPVLIDEFPLFLNLQSISFLFRTYTPHFLIPFFIIKTKQMEFYGNNEVDGDFYTSNDSSEGDFNFDYDELVDDLDELEISDEDLYIYMQRS